MMSTAWLSRNGLNPRTISSFSPVSSGTRVERRNAIQASEKGGLSASSMNSGLIGSTGVHPTFGCGYAALRGRRHRLPHQTFGIRHRNPESGY
jgi:hypothetical protein